ncbi:exported hypothetical protein [Gammaproteobacteria bacterium]
MKLKIGILFFIVFFTAAAAETINVSGTWSSFLVGDIELEQTENRIVGHYQYVNDDGLVKDGEIDGTIIGKKIHAKWLEYPTRGRGRVGEEVNGDLEWTISDDGQRLIGWYRENGERDAGEEEKHEWNLER